MICIQCNEVQENCTCRNFLIAAATISKPISRKKQILTQVGKGLAWVFAVACGATNAGALIALSLIPGGILTYCLATVLFLAVAAMNYNMLRNAVPVLLIDLFGKKRFMQGFTETEQGKPLPRQKKIALGIGFFFALSTGVALGALTYTGILTLLGGIAFLGALSAAFPPIGMLLAGITLICITALMLKAILTIIRTENLIQRYKQFVKDLFNTDPQLPRNKGKSRTRIYAERILTVSFTVLALTLAGIGLFMTTNACALGMEKLLMQMPHVAGHAVNVSSKVIAFGFAMIGQVPFVFKSAINTVTSWMSHKPSPRNHENKNLLGYLKFIGFQTLRLIFAIGNGLISMLGAQGAMPSEVAGVGGMANSIFATNETKDSDEPDPKTTTKIYYSLGKPEEPEKGLRAPQNIPLKIIIENDPVAAKQPQEFHPPILENNKNSTSGLTKKRNGL